MSYSKRFYLTCLSIWAVLAVAILCEGVFAVLSMTDGPDQRETLLSTFFQMWLLNAPLGFVASGPASDALAPHGIELFSVKSSLWQFVGSWAFVSGIGFIQWFVFVPGMWTIARRALMPRRS
jgi:hypothetical protein